MCESDRYIQQRLTEKWMLLFILGKLYERVILAGVGLCGNACFSLSVYRYIRGVNGAWACDNVCMKTSSRGRFALPALSHETHTGTSLTFDWRERNRARGSERCSVKEMQTSWWSEYGWGWRASPANIYFMVTGSWGGGLSSKVGFGLKCRLINWAVMVP